MKREYLQSIQKVNEINNPFIQQLVWLIYCQPITSIKDLSYRLPHQGEITRLIDWVNQLKTELPTEQINYIPLGKYAEKLIKFYLDNNSSTELLAANLQLIENKTTTIGELDYLFEDKTINQFIHLEFSIKYYLKTKRENELIFLGPSAKDFMARKLKKLTDHQTKLSQTHQHLLPEDLNTYHFKPKAIIKGSLFYPWKEWNNKPDKNETNEGWWISIDNINHLQVSRTFFSLITHKVNWIFPFNSNQELFTFEKMQLFTENHLKHFNELMVVCYDEHRNPIDRGFVMRKNWPH